MVKLADTQDLGSCTERCAGSTPASPTKSGSVGVPAGESIFKQPLQVVLGGFNFHSYYANIPAALRALDVPALRARLCLQ